MGFSVVWVSAMAVIISVKRVRLGERRRQRYLKLWSVYSIMGAREIVARRVEGVTEEWRVLDLWKRKGVASDGGRGGEKADMVGERVERRVGIVVKKERTKGIKRSKMKRWTRRVCGKEIKVAIMDICCDEKWPLFFLLVLGLDHLSQQQTAPTLCTSLSLTPFTLFHALHSFSRR